MITKLQEEIVGISTFTAMPVSMPVSKKRDNLPHAFRAGIQRGFYTEHVRSYNSGHLDPLRGGSPLTSLEHLAKI